MNEIIPPRIVITGGPSAGKTTVIQVLSRLYGERLAIAPEAATILFRGGLPRPQSFTDRIHTQRSIYTLQRELELQAIEKAPPGSPLFCDRGSLDGAAYWEGGLLEFCFTMGSTIEREVARYSAVIHLESAATGRGYTRTDVRTETPEEAAVLDEKIGAVWRVHPNYSFVTNQETFARKIDAVIETLDPWLESLEVARRELRYATAADLLL